MPSEIQKLYWKITRHDLKVKLRLYLGHQQAIIHQDFQTLAIIANNALGGGKKSGGDFDEAQIPKNFSEAQMALNGVFGL